MNTPSGVYCSFTLGSGPPDGTLWVMAAGITDEIWSVRDLFLYRIAPTPYVAPKSKSNLGRPMGSKNKPKVAQEALQ
jgi:hypothetical protein